MEVPVARGRGLVDHGGVNDLQNPKLMWLKAGLFLGIGMAAGVLVWVQAPTVGNALLLLLVGWSFSRAYYFTFYVLEKYVDPSFRYAGILSLIRYILRSI